MKLVSSVIKKIEAVKVSPWQILAIFASSIYVRTFFENFTNSNNQGLFNSFLDTFFHYPLWYGAVFLSIILIFSLFTNQSLKKIIPVVAFFSFIIIIPVIIDSLAYGWYAHTYNFIGGSYADLWRDFTHGLGTTDAIGIGIKIEILLVVIGGMLYIMAKTKNMIKSIFGALCIYLSIFFFLSLPVHIMAGYQMLNPKTAEPITQQSLNKFFFEDEAQNSYIPAPTGGMSLEYQGDIVAQNRFSVTIPIVLLFMISILGAVLYYRFSKRKFWAMVKNMRWRRIAHYMLLAAAGLYVGAQLNVGTYALHSLSDWLSGAALLTSILGMWLFSVWTNDKEDLESDIISNPERPLGKGIFTEKQWQNTAYVFLLVGGTAGYLGGNYTFTLSILFLIFYYMYSMQPLRLKKIPILSSVIIALNAAIVFTAGIFVTLGSDRLMNLPWNYIGGIFIIFLLAENVKNIKDIKSDKHHNVLTLPVLLGEKRAQPVVGILTAGALLLTPFFFYLSTVTFLTAAIFAVLMYIVIQKKPFNEKYVFMVYFVFALIFILERILAL